MPLNYQALFDASPNPYLILDRQLNIAGANRAYLDSTQRTLPDIVGRWAWEAFPTDAATEAMAVASFERVIRTGLPETQPLLRFDIPRPESEGGGLEKRFWSIKVMPVFDAQGEVEFVLQHPVDVTELESSRKFPLHPQDWRSSLSRQGFSTVRAKHKRTTCRSRPRAIGCASCSPRHRVSWLY